MTHKFGLVIVFIFLCFGYLGAQTQIADAVIKFNKLLDRDVSKAIAMLDSLEINKEKTTQFTYLLLKASFYRLQGEVTQADSIYSDLTKKYAGKGEYLAWVNLGKYSLFQRSLQVDSLAEVLNRGLYQAEEAGNYYLQAEYYCHLAGFHRDHGDTSLFRKYSDKAEHLAKKYGYHGITRRIISNNAIQYYKQGKVDMAIKCHKLILSSEGIQEDSSSLANTYTNIGTCYDQLDNLDSALYYTLQAYKIYEDRQDKQDMALVMLNAGIISYNMDSNTLANGFLNKAWELSRDNMPDISISAMRMLAYVEQNAGNYEKSLEFANRAFELNDSLLGAVKMRQVAEMNAKYESARQEAEIEKLIIEDEANRNQVILLAGIGLVLAFLTIYGYNRSRVLYRKNKVISKQHVSLTQEKERSESLLLNILPEQTANELKQKGKVEAKAFENVTILFADFLDFTELSAQLTPSELVGLLDEYFVAFDEIVAKNGVEKIKTIGDAYMCAQGLENQAPKPELVIKTAFEMLEFVKQKTIESKKAKKTYFDVRLGLHIGPVVAGVVGLSKFAYDIWGDTVNVAARLEQQSEEGQINTSRVVKDLFENKYHFKSRGKLEMKGKGATEMFYITPIAD